MVNPNFPNLQALFNKQIDLLLASTGLTTKCEFNYGVTNLQVCPNCIYDPSLKKSSGKYKTGGPVPFALGKICPYCNGVGSSGIVKFDIGYLAIIWDYKKWINPPPLVDNPEGYIQTICSKNYLSNIRQCKDLTVIYHSSNANPVFTLYGEPNPIGLGDNNYISTIWKKTGVYSAPRPVPTPSPTLTGTVPIPSQTRTQTKTKTATRTPTRTATHTIGVSATPTNTPTPTVGVSATPTNTPTPTVGVSATPTNTVTPTPSQPISGSEDEDYGSMSGSDTESGSGSESGSESGSGSGGEIGSGGGGGDAGSGDGDGDNTGSGSISGSESGGEIGSGGGGGDAGSGDGDGDNTGSGSISGSESGGEIGSGGNGDDDGDVGDNSSGSSGSSSGSISGGSDIQSGSESGSESGSGCEECISETYWIDMCNIGSDSGGQIGSGSESGSGYEIVNVIQNIYLDGNGLKKTSASILVDEIINIETSTIIVANTCSALGVLSAMNKNTQNDFRIAEAGDICNNTIAVVSDVEISENFLRVVKTTIRLPFYEISSNPTTPINLIHCEDTEVPYSMTFSTPDNPPVATSSCEITSPSIDVIYDLGIEFNTSTSSLMSYTLVKLIPVDIISQNTTTTVKPTTDCTE